MMAPEQMLQSKAGYIDARPLTASSAKPLATHGRTIHSGQTEKNSSRANVFRITPESGRRALQSACPFRANGGHASADLEQAINERTAMQFMNALPMLS